MIAHIHLMQYQMKEAASFSPEQLRMIADFVSKRGGGLLMLGGRRSFAEGGWSGTPLDDKNLGAYLAGDTRLYCQIGDPRHWEAHIAIDQAYRAVGELLQG